MRSVSDRFSALIPYPNQWVTEVSWSNDGWATTNRATFVDGTVVCSQLDQIRWSTKDMTLAEVPLGLTGINGLGSPPIVYRNLVIAGGKTQENPPQGPAGDVRAWDLRTGKLVWTFHSVPRAGEMGNDTWAGDSW